MAKGEKKLEKEVEDWTVEALQYFLTHDTGDLDDPVEWVHENEGNGVIVEDEHGNKFLLSVKLIKKVT